MGVAKWERKYFGKCMMVVVFVVARELTVDHGAGCVDAKWWDGAQCGACAMEVEFVGKMIAGVRATCC